MAEEAILLKRKKKQDEGEEEGPDKDAWMVTFSDLLQLLITFFVLLISMSSMDNKVFKEMFAVFTGGIGELYMTSVTRLHQPELVPEVSQGRVEVDAFKKLLRLDPASTQYEKELENIIESLLVSGIEVLPGTNQFRIRLAEEALFRPGQVEINPELKPTLDHIARILELSLNRVEVTGHTDDTASGMRNYPTNWELSAARAASVLKYLVNAGNLSSERLQAKGYGPYRPVTKNISEAYRMRNRRVEIVIKQFREGSY